VGEMVGVGEGFGVDEVVVTRRVVTVSWIKARVQTAWMIVTTRVTVRGLRFDSATPGENALRVPTS
jgi:hypothetical protein